MNESKDILNKLGIKPILGDKPAGTNVRYDDEFEFVEDELSKQGSMVDRGLVHWDKVIDASINILSNKSKDLKVSCYLTRALFENKGIEGLCIGLDINHQLLKEFWGELFPTKKKARANAYEWLSSKFTPLLEKLEPELDSLSVLQRSYESIHNIELFLNKQLADEAPSLGKLRRLISDLIEPLIELKKIEDEKQKKLKALHDKVESINSSHNLSTENKLTTSDQKSDQSSSSNSVASNFDTTESEQLNHSQFQKQNVSVTSSLSQSIVNISNTISDADSEKDKNKIIRQCHEALRNLSSWSIDQSLDTPSAYAMNRFSTWMGVSQLPMHTNNVTPLRSVPKDKLNIYTNLFNNKNYQELIPQVELSFSKSPFWLDAHRLVSISLEALGMNGASMQIKEHLGVFLRRFPDLLELKFSDQTDFADQLTKQWINAEVLSSSVNETNLSSDSNDTDSSYDDVIKDARELVKQQKMKEAINLFKINISNQDNMRKKTFWKYHLARFCYDNAQHKISYFILKEIDGFMVKNNLKYWEPDLEKNVVYLLIQSLKSSNVSEFLNLEISSSIDDLTENDEPDKTLVNKEINLLYSRLCQLDPILALDF